MGEGQIWRDQEVSGIRVHDVISKESVKNYIKKET